MSGRQPTRIGLISDTHGLIRAEALQALASYRRHFGEIDLNPSWVMGHA